MWSLKYVPPRVTKLALVGATVYVLAVVAWL